MAKPRAVLYIRLSRESAVSTSIQGQNADLYALAEREGWQIVATFEDNGKSGGKQRQNARAALDMLERNEADVLAVYAYDRWSRMGIADSAEVIKAVYARQQSAKRQGTPSPLFVAAREGIRSDQEGWEMRVAFAADIAQKERERMVARRKASIERMREQGRNHGNGPAPYGYRSAPFDDGRPGRRFVVHPGEAAIVREVADRLLAGESATALARDLNARGVPMARSAYRLAEMKGQPTEGLATGVWSSTRIGQAWASQHLLGRITKNTGRSGNGTSREGELVLDPATGLPLQAYEPILTVEQAMALRERFAKNMGRGKGRVRRAARLLSGLVFCGRCGAPLYVSTSRAYPYYRCAGPSRGLDCTGLTATADSLERDVVEHYRRMMAPLGEAFEEVTHRGAPETAETIALLTEQINDVARQLADEDADVPALLERRAALLAQRMALREQKGEDSTEIRPLGVTWVTHFDQSNLESQRRQLARAFDHIDVFRKTDPQRLVFYPNPTAWEPTSFDAD